MAIDAEGVQLSLCSIRKTKYPDSLPDARVALDSAMTREAQEEIVGMRDSLGSQGIWTHAHGGGCCRDVEEAGVDREWLQDVTSGQRRLQSNGYRSECPERLMHGTLRTHIIIFADHGCITCGSSHRASQCPLGTNNSSYTPRICQPGR